MSDRLVLENVTLICISGVKRIRSLISLYRSSRKVHFARIIFVTPNPRIKQLFNIDLLNSESYKLDSIDSYNHFCIYQLSKYVDSEYCLVVQYDSRVINPDCWSDNFFNYDFIGAPWPISEFAYIDPFGTHQRVGNGGFSLRSKKLLEVPSKLSIPWDVNQGDFYRHANLGYLSEDGNICVHNRHLYEKAGCKFAPLEVAAIFSKELPIPENEGLRTFGYHRYRPNSFSLKKVATKFIQRG
jgi:hypothetical protein